MNAESTNLPSTPTPVPTPAPTPSAAPTAAPASATTTISYDLFAKLDLRVATIVSAELHPNADKLLKLRLDDGTPEGRQVCAGIRQWYDPAVLVGRQVVIVANLEPRKIRGEISQGMVLAASDLRNAPSEAPVSGAAAPGDVERDVVILTLERPVKPGSKVS